jgi:predicted ATP-binding protein involved in virulence
LLALAEQFSCLQRGIDRLAARNLKSLVLLIDEGDAFLHLNWQRQYLSLLNEFLSPFKKRHALHSLQVLIASHSPLLAGDVPGCMVQRLGDLIPDVSRLKTFGAPLDDIVFDCFQSNSIGAFAGEIIQSIANRAREGKLTELDRRLIDEVGDPAIRRAILKAENVNGN